VRLRNRRSRLKRSTATKVNDWIALGQRNDHTTPAGIWREDPYPGPTPNLLKTSPHSSLAHSPRRQNRPPRSTKSPPTTTKKHKKTTPPPLPPVSINATEAWSAKELRPARTWRSSFIAWARAVMRVFGVFPWHWTTCPMCDFDQSGGARDMPVTRAAWERFGLSVARPWYTRSPGTLHMLEVLQYT
jgi:hypothetical protein